MKKTYIYESAALHIAVVLLCIFDIPFFKHRTEFDETPPIMVDLENVVISDMTNIPEKAVFGKEQKPATRKEKPKEETAAPQTPEIKEEVKKEEPKIETPKIEAPALVEDELPTNEEIKEAPKKESDEPIKEKKKPAPIPQRKPQIKPEKPKEEKKPQPPAKKTPPTVKKANPLASLMNSVDDLQKQIGTEDAPATIPENMPVNNMGIEGGNSKGSYFSELSVSGTDFVKAKIQESWKTIAGGKDDRNIEVIIRVSLTKEGLIKSVEIADMKRYNSDTYFQALADSAERAIYIAQDTYNVFGVLSKQNSSRYDDWKQISFTFTPLGLTK